MWKQLHFLHNSFSLHGQIVVHYNINNPDKSYLFLKSKKNIRAFYCFLFALFFLLQKRLSRQQISHILLSSLYCVNSKLLRFNILKKIEFQGLINAYGKVSHLCIYELVYKTNKSKITSKQGDCTLKRSVKG